MAKPGEPVTINAPTMRAREESHIPFGRPRAVETEATPVWPPPGYVAVMVPVAKAYEMVTNGEALPCRWSVEGQQG